MDGFILKNKLGTYHVTKSDVKPWKIRNEQLDLCLPLRTYSQVGLTLNNHAKITLL